MVDCKLEQILRIPCLHYVPSGTVTCAGLNLSYRVLHPSGICFGNDSVFSSQTPPVKFWSLKKWKAADPALLIGDFVRL